MNFSLMLINNLYSFTVVKCFILAFRWNRQPINTLGGGRGVCGVCGAGCVCVCGGVGVCVCVCVGVCQCGRSAFQTFLIPYTVPSSRTNLWKQHWFNA